MAPATAVPTPNTAMRELRGDLSPGEFATVIRRAARQIGEHVSCDARYIGRIETGTIRCPNYAYERVFRHIWPDRSLADLGFSPRTAVRGRSAPHPPHHLDEENDDVRRRTFLSGGPTALATVLGLDAPPRAATAPTAHFEPSGLAALPLPLPGPLPLPAPRRVGSSDVRYVEQAVRDIRSADDAHGADTLFERAGQSLRTAYLLLNEGEYSLDTERRLQSTAGELAISVGWLAHDSQRLADARSFYAEALATARMANDPALEAHVFCNSAFLARDAGRPREALRAAQAGQSAARHLDSDRLLSLLAMREAGGWAVLRDRDACERALSRAHLLFERGESEADPEWMSFYGEAEIAGLEAQCWSALGEWDRASDRAALATALQEPAFVRNRALYTAELAHDRLGRGDLAGAGEHGSAAVALLGQVRSARIRGMLAETARRLRGCHAVSEVGAFLAGYDSAVAAA
ncbi:tetratricopeptide repeat protein [Kitasatospora sp. NBC_01287]|uniref:tetratricopeptide repeat protein n=1 Tax=Kitasatospora sp. NBC_01287 TaxID=2903573 RepID=UPI00224E8595|nr:tetratricopeptide repeat protein [Kitasatospora sp. NBC_01287]MCX4748937.1 tetratricopeptide repeat protein [Kitasatospora sp. NBC_01287]